jgi:hypothetical protein
VCAILACTSRPFPIVENNELQRLLTYLIMPYVAAVCADIIQQQQPSLLLLAPSKLGLILSRNQLNKQILF